MREEIAQLTTANVLLVGETEDFFSQGGMIEFTMADGKITYQVNAAALEHSNIHFEDVRSTGANITSQPLNTQTGTPRPVTFRVAPNYPSIAVTMKLTGAVQLEVVVKPDGTVKQARIVGGHPILAEAAMQAVRRWRYEPAPKETIESVKISFSQ